MPSDLNAQAQLVLITRSELRGPQGEERSLQRSVIAWQVLVSYLTDSLAPKRSDNGRWRYIDWRISGDSSPIGAAAAAAASSSLLVEET